MSDFKWGILVGIGIASYFLLLVFGIGFELDRDCLDHKVLDGVCQEMFNSDYEYEEDGWFVSPTFRCVHDKSNPQNLIYKAP